MPRFKPPFLALVSVCLIGSVVSGARPHYGGTLIVETSGTIRAIDPAAPPASPADANAAARVLPLLYETLTSIDPEGGLRPELATSWEGEARGVRWLVRLRRGVTLHDGSILQPSQVADALRAHHADWQITLDTSAVSIATGREDPELPWELADAANAIVVRAGAGGPIGTGPFRVERTGAGVLTLRAHDSYWGSRPFLDTVQVRMGRSPGDQVADLEAGRADMVSVQPTDARRVEQRQLHIVSSRSLELFALVFEPHLATAAADSLRHALAAALDRAAIARVVLQGRAEPAEALLPTWLSGYAPLVLTSADQPLSRPVVEVLPADRRSLGLRVLGSDATAQSIAQRIAVGARDAGFMVTVQAPAGLGPRPDLRLLRLPITATSPGRALADLMTAFGTRTIALVGRITSPDPAASLDSVIGVERALLERDVIVPVVHVPQLYGVGPRVASWNGPPVLPSGKWNFANVWLDSSGSLTP